MEKINAHICPACAGRLNIDEDRKLYLCPFCGVTFDYEYFREDDVLDRGNINLSDGEFKAAAEAYKFILAKDPHCFEALRGLLFAAAGIRELKDLMEIGNVTKLNIEPGEDALKLALSDAEAEDRPFFEKMETILRDSGRINSLIEENEKLSDERDFSSREIERQNEHAESYMFHTREGSYDPRKTLKITLVTLVCSGIPLLLLCFLYPMVWVYLVTCLVPLVIIAAVCLFKMSSLKEIQAIISAKKDALAKIEGKIEANEAECKRLHAEIRAGAHKLASSRKAIMTESDDLL